MNRNSIGPMTAARINWVLAYPGRVVTSTVVLTALGAVCLMEEPGATAAYAVALLFGALLLLGPLAPRRVMPQAHRCPVAMRLARAHPARGR